MHPTSASRLVALSIGLCFAAAVNAQTGATNSNGTQASGGMAQSKSSSSTSATAQGHPTPGGGSAFGEHVSGMAQAGHPIEHGRHFGECVSTMAQGGDCEHEHEEE